MTGEMAGATNAPHTPAALHPPVYQDTGRRPPAEAKPVFTYDQRPITNTFALVTPEQAQAVLDRFRVAYAKLQSPRFAVVVNPGTTNTTGAGTNSPSAGSGLADRQTWRDVERMFGRTLRAGTAQVADQTAVLDVLGQKPVSAFLASGANPSRESLGKLADVIIEVLVSPRMISAPTLSGEVSFAVPDLQATAIRLQDARVLGQATSSDIITRVPPAILRQRDVREIIEATALVLMEDMSRPQ
jgi:hypothetical protein